MPKFNVEVVRHSWGFRTIQVEAEDEFAAADIAVEEAGNYEFSDKNSEYEADSAIRIQEGETDNSEAT